MPEKSPCTCATCRPGPPDAGPTNRSLIPKLITQLTASDVPSGEKAGTQDHEQSSDGWPHQRFSRVTKSSSEMPAFAEGPSSKNARCFPSGDQLNHVGRLPS